MRRVETDMALHAGMTDDEAAVLLQLVGLVGRPLRIEDDLAGGVLGRVRVVFSITKYARAMRVRALVPPVGAGIALRAIRVVDQAVLGEARCAFAGVEPRIPDVGNPVRHGTREVQVDLILVAESALEPDVAAAPRTLTQRQCFCRIGRGDILEQGIHVATAFGVVTGRLRLIAGRWRFLRNRREFPGDRSLELVLVVLRAVRPDLARGQRRVEVFIIPGALRVELRRALVDAQRQQVARGEIVQRNRAQGRRIRRIRRRRFPG